MKDNTKRLKLIQELYNEALKSCPEVDINEKPIEVMRICEEKNALIVSKEEETLIAFVKSKDEKIGNCMRIIFAIKDDEKKGGKNSINEIVLGTIKDVEYSLTFVDSCSVNKIDNRTYVDFLKRI